MRWVQTTDSSESQLGVQDMSLNDGRASSPAWQALDTFGRVRRAGTGLLLCFALAAPPGVAGAQSYSETVPADSVPENSGSYGGGSYGGGSYGGGSYGGGYDQPRQKNRSVFLSLFATHFIPGIAEGLSGWFRDKMLGSGSATEASSSEGSSSEGSSANSGEGGPPIAEERSTAGALSGRAVVAKAAPVASAAGPTLHAGIAYEVLMLAGDGGKVSVDPTKHVFSSGERFEVTYRPNFPGVVEVFNIDPTGKEALIDKLRLQAAELGTLGPYEFVGEKGEDLLRIVLHPCKPQATTRGISRVEMRPEVDRAMRGCDETERSPPRVATRSIAKVAREDGTAFALDPVSRSEIDSGRLAPREVVIRFRHQ